MPPRSTRHSVGWVCDVALALVMLLAAGGCASTKESARSKAVASLREQAEEVRGYGEDLLRNGPAPDVVLRRLRQDKPAVLGGSSSGDAVVWDAVFTAKGSDGGGLGFEDVALRSCVRYSGRVRPDPAVTWESVDCPPSIANETKYGPYNETVRIEPR